MLKKRILILLAVIGFITVFFNIYNNTYADDPQESITILSVSRNNEELEQHNDGPAQMPNYYVLPRSYSSVTVTVRLDNLKDGIAYKLDSNGYSRSNLTSDNNGEIVSFTATPSSADYYQSILNYSSCLSILYISLIDSTDGGITNVYSSDLFFKSDVLGTDNIVIENITQNGASLEGSGREYKANDYSAPISITYRLENLTVGEKYGTGVRYNGYGYGNGNDEKEADDTVMQFTEDIYLNNADRVNYFTVYASVQSWSFSLDSIFLTIKNVDPNFIELGNFRIDNMTQGSRNVVPEYDAEHYQYVYTLNDVEKNLVYLHTEQAMDEISYGVRSLGITGDNSIKYYTGAELKSGIVLEAHYANSRSFPQNFGYFSVENSSKQLVYFNENEEHTALISFIQDDSIPRLNSATLKYSNYPNQEIKHNVDLRYHDSENPLVLAVKGSNFSDNEEYKILVKIDQDTASFGTDIIYNQEFSLSGLDLNSGKDIVLDSFSMSLMNMNHLVFDASMYNIAVQYERQVLSDYYDYGYNNVHHLINFASATDEAGKVLNIGGAAPGFYMSLPTETATVHFSLTGFPEDELFDYEILKNESGDDDISTADVVASGRLSGKELGSGNISSVFGAGFYYLIVKNDMGIISWGKGKVNVNSNFIGLEKISASKNSNAVSLEYDSFPFYPILSDESLDLTLSGKGFDENESYTVKTNLSLCGGNLFYRYESGCIGIEQNSENIFTGKELNDGQATINIPYSEDIYNRVLGGSADYVAVGFEINGKQTFYDNIYYKYVDKSFTASLDGDDTFDEESVVYLSVNDYHYLSDNCDGIAGIMGDLEYDEDKLELLSVEALNDFELVDGDHYVLHNVYGIGAPERTNVLKLVFRNKGLENGQSTTVRFTNISGSDGSSDIEAADAVKTITFTEAIAEIDSEQYNISDNMISKVPTETTVETFIENLELLGGASVKLLSANGDELSSSDKIGTGVRVQLIDRHGTVVNEYQILIKGDINGDGEITITDLVKTKRHLAGLDNYSGIYMKAGDVSNTGAISITDIVKICRHIAGLEAIRQ